MTKNRQQPVTKNVSQSASKGAKLPQRANPVFSSPKIIAGVLVLVLLLIAALVLWNPKPSESSNMPLSRAVYFKEAFQPDRANYNLFEGAAQFLHQPVSEMPRYFNVQNENDIFAALPPVPNDFSEIAYLLATGKYFAINTLGEEYYKQPEFYPNFTDRRGGLRWWLAPDATSWGTNGWGTYPAEQWTTLKRGETESFESTVFLYTGFGVQTYQGLSLMVDPSASNYFDVTISPQTLLLEPSFPVFHSNWAYKITVRGTLKPGTPPGDYLVPVLIVLPPMDKKSEWTNQYRNLYMDAAAGVRPSGNPVDLHVKVE